MFNLKAEFYLKIIFLFSFIALISAFFIEYVLGHQPCNLCLIERIPYGLSIIIIMVIFLKLMLQGQLSHVVNVQAVDIDESMNVLL